jgi:hypothetical protein
MMIRMPQQGQGMRDCLPFTVARAVGINGRTLRRSRVE